MAEGGRKAMEKNTRLINIYLKIHNKKTLTMDDLGYLAQYDPECFEKTCRNVVYNIPEIKPIMEPELLQAQSKEAEPDFTEWQNIEKVLENLKRLEISAFPVADVDAEKVKSLLGNLYMELLFPHNDKYAFMNIADKENSAIFDKRA